MKSPLLERKGPCNRMIALWQHFMSVTTSVLREYRLATLAVLGYFLVYLLNCLYLDQPVSLSLDHTYRVANRLIFIVFYAYVTMCLGVVLVRSFGDPRGVFSAAYRAFVGFFTLRNVVAFALFLLGYILVALAQTNLKSFIPLLKPFSWDPFFYRLDLILGGGVTPWERLHHWVGSRALVIYAEKLYKLWFLVMPMIVMHQFFSPNKNLANRYIVTFVLMWFILGYVIAVTFSSVGPCFYHWLRPAPHSYVEMMRFLEQVTHTTYLTSFALQTQMAPYKEMMNPISAFPSMHVAVATMPMCYARHQHRFFFAVATIYAALITFSSVYLGWHYLSDGLFSIVVVWLIWLGVGWTMRRYSCLQSSIVNPV